MASNAAPSCSCLGNDPAVFVARALASATARRFRRGSPNCTEPKVASAHSSGDNNVVGGIMIVFPPWEYLFLIGCSFEILSPLVDQTCDKKSGGLVGLPWSTLWLLLSRLPSRRTRVPPQRRTSRSMVLAYTSKLRQAAPTPLLCI